MPAKILPELFNGIELRRIWRQRYERHIGGDFDLPGSMKACLIPNHYDMDIGVGFLFKFPKECIDRIRIKLRRDQSDALAALRTGRSKDIQVFKLCLPPAARTRSFYRPLAAQCTLLAKACFILKPYFYCFSRIISTDLPDLSTDFFLKVSLASGLPLECSGRLET
jgi:hypothetical protein